MADEIRLIYKSFDEILKLKQQAKYSNKYNKALSNFCELVCKKLEDQNGSLEKLIKLNCLALSAAIEFCTNPNSEIFDVVQMKCTTEALSFFLKSLKNHLNFFKVDVEIFEGYSAIRLNEIIHLNCAIFIELFNTNEMQTDIQLFNQLIKHLCLILFEIITSRVNYEYHVCYDVLQKRNSDALKLLLEIKIDALGKYTSDENETKIIENILEIHNNLLREITGYIDATTTDFSESE